MDVWRVDNLGIGWELSGNFKASSGIYRALTCNFAYLGTYSTVQLLFSRAQRGECQVGQRESGRCVISM